MKVIIEKVPNYPDNDNLSEMQKINDEFLLMLTLITNFKNEKNLREIFFILDFETLNFGFETSHMWINQKDAKDQTKETQLIIVEF